jgi:hypothetical protein
MKRGKKAQIKISFGMIFSIFLIVAFLAFGFGVIYKFLGLMESAKTADFVNDFQNDVDTLWKSTMGANPGSYTLPSKVQKVCLADFSIPSKGKNSELIRDLNMDYSGNENLFLYPSRGLDLSSFEIKHLDLEKIVQNENPFCFEVVKGKVNIQIKMNSGDALVELTR